MNEKRMKLMDKLLKYEADLKVDVLMNKFSFSEEDATALMCEIADLTFRSDIVKDELREFYEGIMKDQDEHSKR